MKWCPADNNNIIFALKTVTEIICHKILWNHGAVLLAVSLSVTEIAISTSEDTLVRVMRISNCLLVFVCSIKEQTFTQRRGEQCL